VSENDNGTSVNPNTEGLDLPSNAGTQINTKVDDSLRESKAQRRREQVAA